MPSPNRPSPALRLRRAEAEHALADIQAHIDKDATELQELDRALERLEPELVEAGSAEERSMLQLRQAEEALSQWQENWGQHSGRIGVCRQSVQVEEARIEQLLKQQARMIAQKERLEALSADPMLSYQVKDNDWRNHQHCYCVE